MLVFLMKFEYVFFSSMFSCGVAVIQTVNVLEYFFFNRSLTLACCRWFNFYGFDEGEIPNFAEVIAQSGKLVPCTYMGRLLLSARAERLDKNAELLAAHSVAAAPYEDPRVIPLLLFADVYEVKQTPPPGLLKSLQRYSQRKGDLHSRTLAGVMLLRYKGLPVIRFL